MFSLEGRSVGGGAALYRADDLGPDGGAPVSSDSSVSGTVVGDGFPGHAAVCLNLSCLGNRAISSDGWRVLVELD